MRKVNCFLFTIINYTPGKRTRKHSDKKNTQIDTLYSTKEIN